MHRVERIIPAPPSLVWRILTDTREWPLWGPSVRAVQAPSALIGPGLRGRIQTPVGLWIPFEITRWEQDRAWSWRVAGIEATGHRLEPISPTRCRVTFEIPRWAPLYRPVCETALRRIATRAAAMASR